MSEEAVLGKVKPMRPSQLVEALRFAYKIGRPIMVWGPPGVGKSDIVKQVTQLLGIGMVDLRMLQLDPVDIRGLPRINGKNYVEWLPPNFLPRNDNGKGILFLDELSSAPQLVQNSGLQLINDRRCGDYILPAGWLPVAAGNRAEDRAFVHKMSKALANRLIHVELYPDKADWIAWALQNDVAAELIGFINWRPNLLFNFDPKSQENAFATPRTWEFVSDILKEGPDPDFELQLLQGCVGAGPAAELVAFLQIYRKLPEPDYVVMNPATAEIPKEPNVMYALCGALASRAADNTFSNIVEYSMRMSEEWSTKLMQDIVRKDKQLMKTRAYATWASKHYRAMTGTVN